MSPKMIRETYPENLPYIEGYKVSLCRPKGKYNVCDLQIDSRLLDQELGADQESLILNWLAEKSLTTTIYLSANERDYNIRHALAERLERIRNEILEEGRDAAGRARENRKKCNI